MRAAHTSSPTTTCGQWWRTLPCRATTTIMTTARAAMCTGPLTAGATSTAGFTSMGLNAWISVAAPLTRYDLRIVHLTTKVIAYVFDKSVGFVIYRICGSLAPRTPPRSRAVMSGSRNTAIRAVALGRARTASDGPSRRSTFSTTLPSMSKLGMQSA